MTVDLATVEVEAQAFIKKVQMESLDRQAQASVAEFHKARGIVPRENFAKQFPTPRQKLFLDLRNEKEVFYGGAAGGGKSSALLMAALEHAHVPNYSALLLRRTYSDLAKQGALMDRAKEWLSGSGASWNEQKKMWTFPSGAKLAFGYLETENDKFQYQGAEYQFIGFDELSQFTESQYTYLFSRLRRLKDSNVPIRMRSGSNPGGIGSKWVNERFIPEGFTPDDAIVEKVWEKDITDDETGDIIKRFFVPARLDDNPHLDQAEYELSLRELDPVTRAQLRRGDWQISVRGDILYMWDERFHVISWSEFEKVFGTPYIPLHWKIGVFQDAGTTEGHPCITSWFATASANSPGSDGISLAGSVFYFRSLMATKTTAREMKQKIFDLMQPYDEIPRTAMWEMSHEASSERLEYHKVDATTPYVLPFINWQTGRTRGIEQLKYALTLQHPEKKHPFREELYGRPSMYVVVADNELNNPKTDAGMLRFRQEAPAYHWNMPKTGETPVQLVPYPLFNDACFVAGTLITTLRGDVPIERVMPNDLVLTREGYRSTSGALLTNTDVNVRTYIFSDGTALTATANHPIYNGGKFIAIDTLREASIIEGWKVSKPAYTLKLLHLMASIFIGIPYPLDGQCPITSIRNITMPSEGLRHYISRFGDSITATFRKATIFITKTSIHLTTIWTTLNASVPTIIGHDIVADPQAREYGQIWRKSDHWLANGTEVKKDENGIKETGALHGLAERLLNKVVSNVEKFIPLGKRRELNIVVTDVEAEPLIGDSGMRRKFGYVSGVLARLKRANLASQSAVQIHVVNVSPETKASVYNLSVDDHPEYFANGLLVHNCDTVRSAAAKYFPRQTSLSEEERLYERMPDMYKADELSDHEKRSKMLWLQREFQQAEKARQEKQVSIRGSRGIGRIFDRMRGGSGR